MVHFRLYLKQYRAWRISVIAFKSVIEAMNISSELQFPTDLMLARTHLQYFLNTFILLKSIYLLLWTIFIPYLNQVYDEQKKNIFQWWFVCVV